MANQVDNKKPLTAKQAAFVAEYLIDLNATQAAIRAGYSAKTAEWIGPQLLGKTHVAESIREAQQKRAERTEISADKVLSRYWQIATANANSLIQFRRNCCRHCYGTNFLYQWKSEREFQEAVEAAATQGENAKLPVDDGGYGYDKRLRPNPECPECCGEGKGEIFAFDTRDVPAESLVLYAGAKQTQGGFEVKVHDQLAALQSVARHLGMFNDKVSLDVSGSVELTHTISPELQSTLEAVYGTEIPE